MKRGVFVFWSLFTAAVVFRLWQGWNIRQPDIGDCLHKDVHGVGRIDEEPEIKDSAQVLVVSAEEFSTESGVSCPAGLTIRMRVHLYPRFSYDERITFTGTISAPMNFQSGDRIFDYRGYLAKSDIFYEIRSAHVDLETAGMSHAAHLDIMRTVSGWLYTFKKHFVEHVRRHLGEPQASLAAGLVVGEKAALGKDLIADFRTVGLIHIVVLSGYNITIVGDAIRRLLSRLPRIWGIVLAGLSIVIFGIMVGGGATVVRSCVMAGVALFGSLIRREYSVIRALMLAGALMLIQNPRIFLHDPSFQLSFLATIGLLLLAGPIERRLTRVPEAFGIRGVVAATVATQIFVTPYILYMMGQISLIGMLANILVLPFVPISMLSVVLVGASGFVSDTAAMLSGYAAHLLLSYELFIVRTLASVPFSAVHIPAFSFAYVVCFYAVFVIVFIGLRQRHTYSRSPPS